MVEEIKTLDERKEKLIALGKKQGYVTYEQLAEHLKGLEIDSDSLDPLRFVLPAAKYQVALLCFLCNSSKDTLRLTFLKNVLFSKLCSMRLVKIPTSQKSLSFDCHL